VINLWIHFHRRSLSHIFDGITMKKCHEKSRDTNLSHICLVLLTVRLGPDWAKSRIDGVSPVGPINSIDSIDSINSELDHNLIENLQVELDWTPSVQFDSVRCDLDLTTLTTLIMSHSPRFILTKYFSKQNFFMKTLIWPRLQCRWIWLHSIIPLRFLAGVIVFDICWLE